MSIKNFDEKKLVSDSLGLHFSMGLSLGSSNSGFQKMMKWIVFLVRFRCL